MDETSGTTSGTAEGAGGTPDDNQGGTPGGTPGGTLGGNAVQDGQSTYRERLTPSFGVWAILVGFAVSVGAILLPFGPAVGVIAFIVCIVALLTLGWMSGAVIEVRSGRLHAGRAEIERGFVRQVEPLDTEAMRVGRGTGLDARAFLCLRGWVSTGVRVWIDDPQDPTPYWLISTRHPDRLADALRRT